MTALRRQELAEFFYIGKLFGRGAAAQKYRYLDLVLGVGWADSTRARQKCSFATEQGYAFLVLRHDFLLIIKVMERPSTGAGENQCVPSVLGDAWATTSINSWPIITPLRARTTAAPARSGSR
jgi:hypothetical protein